MFWVCLLEVWRGMVCVGWICCCVGCVIIVGCCCFVFDEFVLDRVGEGVVWRLNVVLGRFLCGG